MPTLEMVPVVVGISVLPRSGHQPLLQLERELCAGPDQR